MIEKIDVPDYAGTILNAVKKGGFADCKSSCKTVVRLLIIRWNSTRKMLTEVSMTEIEIFILLFMARS